MIVVVKLSRDTDFCKVSDFFENVVRVLRQRTIQGKVKEECMGGSYYYDFLDSKGKCIFYCLQSMNNNYWEVRFNVSSDLNGYALVEVVDLMRGMERRYPYKA